MGLAVNQTGAALLFTGLVGTVPPWPLMGMVLALGTLSILWQTIGQQVESASRRQGRVAGWLSSQWGSRIRSVAERLPAMVRERIAVLGRRTAEILPAICLASMAGLPLTASFYPRWLLLRDLSQLDPRYVWLLVIAGVGVAIGYLRGLHVMLASPTDQNHTEQAGPAWLTMIFLAALVLLSIGLSIYPDPVLRVAERLLITYPLPPL